MRIEVSAYSNRTGILFFIFSMAISGLIPKIEFFRAGHPHIGDKPGPPWQNRGVCGRNMGVGPSTAVTLPSR